MYLKSLLVLALGLLLSAPVWGQTQPPSAQPAQPSLGQAGPYPVALYRMDNVSRALNLSQLQTERLNQLSQQIQERYRNDLNNVNALTGLTPQERAARLEQLTQQYNGAWLTGAQNVLSEAQLGRYRQLGLQIGGFHAFTDLQVKRQLNLTNMQVQQLNAARQWSQQQVQNIATQAALNPNQAAGLYRDYLAQSQTRLNGILTPEQQRMWQGMIGEPFSFQQNPLRP
jgi:hypothetical protein